MKEFQSGTLKWVKGTEVLVIELLDILVAVPVVTDYTIIN